MTEQLNILSDDFSDGMVFLTPTISNFSLGFRLGMWGEAMFGSPEILGAGHTNTYSNEELHIILIDEVPAFVVHIVMTNSLRMWGSSMFGSVGIFGSGYGALYDTNGNPFVRNHIPLYIKQI